VNLKRILELEFHEQSPIAAPVSVAHAALKPRNANFKYKQTKL
jgi:hypothetical protein